MDRHMCQSVSKTTSSSSSSTTTTTTRRLTQARPYSCGDLHRKTLAVDMDVERGAAWRRRQRRLRSWWRHEQQTVAAVLATVTHHSHSKVGTANDAPRGQKKVTSTRVGPAEYFKLSSDDGRPTGGERGQRHCWSPGRRGRLSGTPASGSSWSIVSMFLCRRLVNSCRMSCSSLPHSCRWLPSRLSKCRKSCLLIAGRTVGGSADGVVSFFAAAAYCRAYR